MLGDSAVTVRYDDRNAEVGKLKKRCIYTNK